MNNSLTERKTTTEIEADVLPVIQERKSYRAFSQKNIEPENIKMLFEAARWAPSSMNEQPWVYICATKDQPERYKLIFDTLYDGNRIWAERAPLLILSLARKKHVKNGVINGSAKYDVGSANAFLSLQATALGLSVHQMGGFDVDKIRTAFSIPQRFQPMAMITLGYQVAESALNDSNRDRELAARERQALGQRFFSRAWGKAIQSE